MASGNAVEGASTKPLNFPKQIIALVDDETSDYVAANAGVSKSALLRELIADGIALRKLGHEYGVPLDDLLDAARVWADGTTEPEKATTLVVDALS